MTARSTRYLTRHFQTLHRSVATRAQVQEWPEDLHLLEPEGVAADWPAFSYNVEPEPQGSSRKSEAAQYGTASSKGKVKLPSELCDVVRQHIQDSDKQKLRRDALDLFSHFRSSSVDPRKPQPSTSRDPRPKNTLPPYNTEVSLAYAAACMPTVYAATHHVLAEAAKRLDADGWQPAQLLDFGSGTSSAAWVAAQLWGDHLSRYVAYDQAKPMQWLAASFLQRLPQAQHKQLATSLYLEDLLSNAWQPPVVQDPERTMALAAFTLGEMGHPAKRHTFVEKLFNSGAEVVIIIDRGTPAGFRLVAEARAQLLALSKKSGSPGHIVAPCPHDKPCPLRYTRDFCHFPQRLERPDFVRLTKHSSRGDEDSNFSYVVFRRQPRPSQSDHTTDVASIAKQGPLHPSQITPPTEMVFSETSPQGTDYFDVKQTEEVDAESSIVLDDPVGVSNAMKSEAAAWPRLVAPPLKRSGHVLLDGCAPSGKIERFIIPKSQGKQAYADARKARWGDLFPHMSKSDAQRRDRGVRKLSPVRGPKEGQLGDDVFEADEDNAGLQAS